VKDIIKENAGPLAEGILNNPNATRELLADSIKHGSAKSKKLYNEIKEDTQSFASDQAGKAKERSKVSLSDALASSTIGKRMKGRGQVQGSVEGELTKPKPQRKRLTTIVPVAMPMHGDGSRYIGQQWGNGARVIGGQH